MRLAAMTTTECAQCVGSGNQSLIPLPTQRRFTWALTNNSLLSTLNIASRIFGLLCRILCRRSKSVAKIKHSKHVKVREE